MLKRNLEEALIHKGDYCSSDASFKLNCSQRTLQKFIVIQDLNEKYTANSLRNLFNFYLIVCLIKTLNGIELGVCQVIPVSLFQTQEVVIAESRKM